MPAKTPAPVHPVHDALNQARRIVWAENDTLIDDAGHRLIDMFSANGAALLGHAHPKIAAAIKVQLDGVWLTGGLLTPAYDLAKTALESFLPPGLGLAGLYSTGMEAAEFAMRMARVHTGRSDFVGFSCAMHGKSAATAALSWANAPPLAHIHRLPEPGPCSELQVIEQLEQCLRDHSVAAVFVEPVMGTGGGYVISADFYGHLIALCQAHGSLLVMDEILSGFYRTGPRFAFLGLPVHPDLVLLGKALANAFPASAVVARRDIRCTPAMLPGSTYAGNPLAAAAIAATLDELRRLNVSAMVAAIATTIKAGLADVPGLVLRGRGALWMIELASPQRASEMAKALYARGVFASFTGNYLRLLPSATIKPENLQRACQTLRDLLQEQEATRV